MGFPDPEKQTEIAAQIEVVKYLKLRNRAYCFVPNEGVKLAEAALIRAFHGMNCPPSIMGATRQIFADLNKRLSAMGLATGFPDLLVFDPEGNRPQWNIALEMKSPKGSVRPEQRAWLEALEKRGWKTIVGKGSGPTIDELEKFL